jgi:hypothetical protein
MLSVRYFTTMLVSDYHRHAVMRFNVESGAFVDDFIEAKSGGLDGPWGIAFFSQERLVVASSNTDAVLRYDPATGAFIAKFCSVPSPRGLTFHHGDLFVVSSRTSSIYRFHAQTGAGRGLLARSPLLDSAFGILFETHNTALVASQARHHVVEVTPPDGESSLHQRTMYATGNMSAVRVWSQERMQHITGLDLSSRHLYTLSPYGEGVLQHNRTTGAFVRRYVPEKGLEEAYDVKYHQGSVYVCGKGGVKRATVYPRSYNLMWGQQGMFTPGQDHVRCTFLLIHSSQEFNRGK